MILDIPATLADTISAEAQARGLSVSDFLEAVLRTDRLAAERQAVELEQTWWLGRPLSERAPYEGQYVAVCGQEVVDSDLNRAALRARIRARFGRRPVLIMPSEGPREVHIVSPRIVSP
jgi:hypothetical protein